MEANAQHGQGQRHRPVAVPSLSPWAQSPLLPYIPHLELSMALRFSCTLDLPTLASNQPHSSGMGNIRKKKMKSESIKSSKTQSQVKVIVDNAFYKIPMQWFKMFFKFRMLHAKIKKNARKQK